MEFLVGFDVIGGTFRGQASGVVYETYLVQ